MSDIRFDDPRHAQSHLTYVVMCESKHVGWYEVDEYDAVEDAQERADRLNAKQAEENEKWDAQTKWMETRGAVRSEPGQRLMESEMYTRYAVFVREVLPLRPSQPIEPNPRQSV